MVDCHGLNYRDHILVEINPISVNNDSETTHRSSIYTLSYLKFNLESIDVYIVGSGQNFTFYHFLTVVYHAKPRSRVTWLIFSQNAVD